MTDTEREALCARIDELCAEVERLRQENQSISMAAYEVGYKNGSVHYELEHCPACKNVADLQEALDENAKLRELAIGFDKCLDTAMYLAGVNGFATMPDQELFDSLRPRMRELGVVK